MHQTEITRTAATTYFDAWRTRDFDRLRTVLAPDVEFVGVMGTANGAAPGATRSNISRTIPAAPAVRTPTTTCVAQEGNVGASRSHRSSSPR